MFLNIYRYVNAGMHFDSAEFRKQVTFILTIPKMALAEHQDPIGFLSMSHAFLRTIY